ncbi:MAG: pilus assembly protein PilM [Phycisphaerales bacterium]|nr:pilus assembly protein PilM [Planctomycetota bacterium]MCH8507792.1 pilus assembly protein PilM [Phycisphaerales bacterium]
MNRPRFPLLTLSPIGLEIGGGEVRAAQLSRTQEGDRLVCHAVFPRRDGPGPAGVIEAEEAAWIAGVLERRGFVGKKVAITAPHGACSAHIVDLPDRESGAPAELIARAEIARTRRCPPDRFELATWYLPQRGRTDRGLAIACERPDLEKHLDHIEQAGLIPLAVDLEEAALARACGSTLRVEPDGIHALLRIGWNATLGVLTLGDTVVYTRRFEIGIGPYLTRFREQTGISWNDACRVLESHQPETDEPDVFESTARAAWHDLAVDLGHEIDTAITYVTHAHRTAPVGHVQLAGYGATRPECLSILDEVLGMPVQPADTGVITPDDATKADLPRAAVAIGLAGRFDE